MSDNIKGFSPKYDDNKPENMICVSEAVPKTDGTTYRRVELLMSEDTSYLSEKNKELDTKPVEFVIKDQIMLYETPGGQQKIFCWLVESKGRSHIPAIHISRRTGKGVFGSEEVTLQPLAVYGLKQFLNTLTLIDTPNKLKIPITSESDTSIKNSSAIISEADFSKLIRENIKSTDDFYKLISVQKMELAVEQLETIIQNHNTSELEIQGFLKFNIWMFGNDYVHIVENGKINTQNILDMIPQDFESYIDIIEVKLPQETLFRFDDSHKNYYPSSHLTKAISQTQNYIFELEKKTTDTSYQELNGCKIVRPKGVVLFGSEKQLDDNEKQYLRILNSSYHNIQVITYQQLLEKAKNSLKVLQEG